MNELLYIDMDGVLADYDSAAEEWCGDPDATPHHEVDRFFRDLPPVPGAVEAFNQLVGSSYYEVYILSRPPWSNTYAWTDKRLWVEEHLGNSVKDRLILAHDKHLLRGEILIDDHERHAEGFDSFIHFGSEEWPTWEKVLSHLI